MEPLQKGLGKLDLTQKIADWKTPYMSNRWLLETGLGRYWKDEADELRFNGKIFDVLMEGKTDGEGASRSKASIGMLGLNSLTRIIDDCSLF